MIPMLLAMTLKEVLSVPVSMDTQEVDTWETVQVNSCVHMSTPRIPPPPQSAPIM